MSYWYDCFNSQGFIIVVGAIIGIIGVAVKSKCSNTRCCWGCIDIQRDTTGEVHEDELAMQLQANRTAVSTNIV